MELSKEKLLWMYKEMITIRKFEEMTFQLFKEGFIHGWLHAYIGEEAVAVGACADLRKDDYILSTHRGHGHCIAKGANLKNMMAEIFGRKDGYCKGKGGSMHIVDYNQGIVGANGIVGAGIPIATGCGLSSKMRGTNQVTICFFGDGASNQGTFHEAINLASIWKLPVIYLCENNFYGISLHQSKHQAVKNVADRAAAYNIPGVVVDGNDVISVYNATNEAVKRARNGGGPTLLECQTYRWREHSEVDPPARYRTKEEVEEWKKKCPIKRFRTQLVQMNAVEENEVVKIEQDVQLRIEEAVEFAKNSPEPEPEEAKTDIYV